jgi:drug/metabolite transporter (DMT)-like permease
LSVYCALLAVFFLKKKLYRHHWTSMGVIIVSVIFVGIGYIVGKKDGKVYTVADSIVGLTLLQIG